MAYRKFDTGTWTDPWFEQLSPRAKLAFIYFWTNSQVNQAGLYELSEKRISFELGYGIDTIYIELQPKVYWNDEKGWIWVFNFFRHQCQNPKFAAAAVNCIRDYNERLQLFMCYNRSFLEANKVLVPVSVPDTISIPYLTVQNRTVQYQNRKEKTKCVPPTSKRPYSQSFEDWWSVYPNKVGKDAAWKSWQKRNGDMPPVADMIYAVREQIKEKDRLKQSGDFCPNWKNPATWINNGCWADQISECLDTYARLREKYAKESSNGL